MARSVPPRFHRHLVKVDNCAIGGSHVRSQTSYIYRGVQDRARAPAAGIGQDHCGDRPGARHPCQCACPLVPGGTSRPGPGNNPGCLQVEADELVKLRRENGLLRKERDFLKSAAAYFARRFPIRLMARALEVSAAGYYAWARRPESARSQDNRDLTGQIRTLPSHLRQPGDHGGAQVARPFGWWKPRGEAHASPRHSRQDGNDRLPAQAARRTIPWTGSPRSSNRTACGPAISPAPGAARVTAGTTPVSRASSGRWKRSSCITGIPARGRKQDRICSNGSKCSTVGTVVIRHSATVHRPSSRRS